MDPDTLCEIALQLRQWRAYMRVVEINELYRYGVDGKVEVIANQQQLQMLGTQERIDYLYKVMLDNRPPQKLVADDRKFDRLKVVLR